MLMGDVLAAEVLLEKGVRPTPTHDRCEHGEQSHNRANNKRELGQLRWIQVETDQRTRKSKIGGVMGSYVDETSD